MDTAPEADPLSRAFVAAHPGRCARQVAGRGQRCFYAALAAGWGVLLIYRWDLFVLLATAVLSLLYLAAVAFRGTAAVLSLRGGAGRDAAAGPEAPDDAALPVYTVLVPLYREANIVDRLLAGIAALDYPKEKLDVKLLLEADDAETAAALHRHGVPDYCEIIVAPDLPPRTKPRACNYGLAAARGEFCVIFDAEDRPEPDQLRKALAVFRRDRTGRVACVQAKLNYFNSRRNWLTRLFTVEYSVNFDLMLAGMQRFRLPLPLGGTSNHFRTELLRRIGPWDPFNVTEDCDLGIRIYEQGFETRLVDSTTWEEANCELGNWLRQRSRWVKGFAQTHLVHFRRPWETLRRLGVRGFCGAYLAVGGSVLMMLTNVVCWAVLLLYGGLLVHGAAHGLGIVEQIVGPHPVFPDYTGLAVGPFRLQAWPLVYRGATENPFWSGLSVVCCAAGALLFLSNFGFILIGLAACRRRKFYHLMPAALLMPLYWLLISIGAWKGVLQLFTRPFYWEKTRHGLSGSETAEETNPCPSTTSSAPVR